MKKRNRNDVVLLKMQIFTDEQELINRAAMGRVRF